MIYFYAFILSIAISLTGCPNRTALVNASVDNIASPSESISMGRDDDDGKAQKWHIGGGSE